MSDLPNPIPIRDQLIHTRGWTLVRVFDTNEHEPYKDVCLIRTTDGTTLVVRVGERRPSDFFPNGYLGTTIVVPRLYESSATPLFEVEEFFPGELLETLDPHPSTTSIVRPDLQTKCIDGFWELLDAFATQPLELRWDREKQLEKHLQRARTILSDTEQRRVDAVLATSTAFWQPTHPAKWKYALDNIILLPDGRLGLVDLARVGRYFWGYDLGWIVWPQWFRLPTAALRQPSAYLATLERFVDEVIARAPVVVRSDDDALRRRIILVLLERTIGACYDVVESISHTRRPLADPNRRVAFIHFLHELLAWVLDRSLDAHH